jgi:hypothetical protein
MPTPNPADIERIAQGQMEAYGTRDLERFMSFWAEDAQYYLFPSTLIADGAAAIRERHIVRFRETNLAARLVKRIILGNLSVSHEIITRTFPEGPGTLDLVAMHEIENDKITRAWFKLGDPVLNRAP